ncbi:MULTISPECIES: hypothetical protein [unclassified Microbacterium]|uniref:hypothetical protein n=1 Tax=unclassified Microbacterium TaxID=2609290 RepID=UPI00068FCE64|nr:MULTISPECIES: hypothetical protein [unclassified Microbacterium]
MPHPRPALGAASAFAALVVMLAGCTAAEPEADPTPTATATATGETMVSVSVDGPEISGTGPTEPFPGVDFPLREGMRSVTIDFTCDGGGPFRVELGDPMTLGQATLSGTCDGTTALVWPITEETGPTLNVWVTNDVAWTATPHFSTAEFLRDEAITTECDAFSDIYSAFSNADIGYTEYQAFDQAEWTRRVDAAIVDLETLAGASETTMSDPFTALLSWVQGDGHTPGALLQDTSLIDPISDTCNTNHSPLILIGEFGG